MAHCCPNPKCQESAPVLFRYCPECDFDMIECMNGKCTHKPRTMGEKYFMEKGECYCCGGNNTTDPCHCFDGDEKK